MLFSFHIWNQTFQIYYNTLLLQMIIQRWDWMYQLGTQSFLEIYMIGIYIQNNYLI